MSFTKSLSSRKRANAFFRVLLHLVKIFDYETGSREGFRQGPFKRIVPEVRTNAAAGLFHDPSTPQDQLSDGMGT